MDKRLLRKEALKKRRSMLPKEREQESRIVAEKIIAMPEFKRAATVFAYVSVEDEVHTEEILQAVLNAGKRLCVPYITDSKNGSMIAVELKKINDLVSGVFDIPTAPAYAGKLLEVKPEEMDIIIVPGAAFDNEGQRIGMGGGYYDRFLGKTTALKIGVAYQCQIYDELPVEHHDQKVDVVIYKI